MDGISIIKALLIIGIFVMGAALLFYLLKYHLIPSSPSPEIEAEYVRAGIEVAIGHKNGRVASGTIGGIPFVLVAGPNVEGSGNPGATVLSIPSSLDEAFQISREGSRDLSGCDLVALQFPDPKRSEAVRALFGLGFDIVRLRDRKLSAKKLHRSTLLHLDMLRTTLDCLAALGAISGTQAPAADECLRHTRAVVIAARFALRPTLISTIGTRLSPSHAIYEV